MQFWVRLGGQSSQCQGCFQSLPGHHPAKLTQPSFGRPGSAVSRASDLDTCTCMCIGIGISIGIGRCRRICINTCTCRCMQGILLASSSLPEAPKVSELWSVAGSVPKASIGPRKTKTKILQNRDFWNTSIIGPGNQDAEYLCICELQSTLRIVGLCFIDGHGTSIGIVFWALLESL